MTENLEDLFEGENLYQDTPSEQIEPWGEHKNIEPESPSIASQVTTGLAIPQAEALVPQETIPAPTQVASVIPETVSVNPETVVETQPLPASVKPETLLQAESDTLPQPQTLPQPEPQTLAEPQTLSQAASVEPSIPVIPAKPKDGRAFKAAEAAAKQEPIKLADVAAYFDTMNFHPNGFAQFTAETVHTHAIETFKVLFHRGDEWVPHPPTQYIPTTKVESQKGIPQKRSRQIHDNDAKGKKGIGEVEETVQKGVAVLAPKFDQMVRPENKSAQSLRATKLPSALAGFSPVFCAVLRDGETRYVIPADGLQRASEWAIAQLFWAAYPADCRPPGWTVGDAASDADRYIVDGAVTLRDATVKDPAAQQAFVALETLLAEYRVGKRSWNQLAWRVYRSGPDLARLPCTTPVSSKLEVFGYTKSGFQTATQPPVAVYARTPFVGLVDQGAVVAARAERKALQARYEQLLADAIARGVSRTAAVTQYASEFRLVDAAQLRLVQALTPPVLLIDTLSVAGPTYTAQGPEARAALALPLQEQETYVRHRLEQCFDAIFAAASLAHSPAVVLGVFGAAPDFIPLGLDAPSYETYFAMVLQATMKLFPRIKVFFLDEHAPEGAERATFPAIVADQPYALFVNDMGPDTVVGNCNFKDTTRNGVFGSRTALAFLTLPLVNTRIQPKTVPSPLRDYTRPPKLPDPPKASTDPFAIPHNQPSDYLVAEGRTLNELAVAGDAHVRNGYVPCGGVSEVPPKFYQAFVRVHLDPLLLWKRFEAERVRYAKN